MRWWDGSEAPEALTRSVNTQVNNRQPWRCGPSFQERLQLLLCTTNIIQLDVELHPPSLSIYSMCLHTKGKYSDRRLSQGRRGFMSDLIQICGDLFAPFAASDCEGRSA